MTSGEPSSTARDDDQPEPLTADPRPVDTERLARLREVGHAPEPPVCPTICDDDCDARCHEWHQVTAKRSHIADSCQHPDGPLVADWYRCKAVKPGNYGSSALTVIPGAQPPPGNYGETWPICALEVNHEGPHRARLMTTWRRALPAEFRPEFEDE